ncbi:hypothetical protein H5410_022200 [Solanum commersonii]|uniref:Uncharacterized protein n=1 Tax=Solanum commersonii TaxID=4109 RepID=A0A9J5ZG32_SOLCO|nr:hypothetical protein H5410_022200 [Solanum commersonii]
MRRLLPFSTDLIISFRAQHSGTKDEVRPFDDSPGGLDHLRTQFLNIAQNESNLWTHQHPQLKLLLVLKQTQVQPFKKGVSNNATQDSIMNAHNKTQFTFAKIKCALKDSSCDSPISKNLMLTILASNASSSSTKVFKCPHTRNDYIFTQWFVV